MTVQTFDVQPTDLASAISVTPAAVEHFQRQLLKTGKQGIRISLKESGCTGYMYVIEEVEGPESGDVTKLLDGDVTLYIDPRNIPALRGTEIDFTKQGLNQNLVMNNPNVKDACGCGESFSI